MTNQKRSRPLKYTFFCISLFLLLRSASPLAVPNRQIRALYAGKAALFSDYQTQLQIAFQKNNHTNLNNDIVLTDDVNNIDPTTVDYILYNPISKLQDFSPYTNLKAVFSLRAGVDQEANNPTLPISVPLTRMVDPGLREGMREYVLGHVLRYHLQIDRLWEQKRQMQWSPKTFTLARQTTVGILGLGELGSYCADALLQMNFKVCGWSRTRKQIEGVECYHGSSGWREVIAASDILVLLLPETPETLQIIRRETLQKCKAGVYIINVGRGSSINDNDLMEALHKGKVAGATLDVFQEEPLPLEHPYWKHPNVLITPHIAAKSWPSTASVVIAENIRRCESGEPLLYVVDRDAGY